MTRVRPMDQVVSESLVTDRFALVVFGSPSQLYNVGAIDVRALIAVIAILLASAVLACDAPARRATKIDPMIAPSQLARALIDRAGIHA